LADSIEKLLAYIANVGKSVGQRYSFGYARRLSELPLKSAKKKNLGKGDSRNITHYKLVVSRENPGTPKNTLFVHYYSTGSDKGIFVVVEWVKITTIDELRRLFDLPKGPDKKVTTLFVRAYVSRKSKSTEVPARISFPKLFGGQELETPVNEEIPPGKYDYYAEHEGTEKAGHFEIKAGQTRQLTLIFPKPKFHPPVVRGETLPAVIPKGEVPATRKKYEIAKREGRLTVIAKDKKGLVNANFLIRALGYSNKTKSIVKVPLPVGDYNYTCEHNKEVRTGDVKINFQEDTALLIRFGGEIPPRPPDDDDRPRDDDDEPHPPGRPNDDTTRDIPLDRLRLGDIWKKRGKSCWLPIIGMIISGVLTQMWFFFAFLFWFFECVLPDPINALEKKRSKIASSFDKRIEKLEKAMDRDIRKSNRIISGHRKQGRTGAADIEVKQQKNRIERYKIIINNVKKRKETALKTEEIAEKITPNEKRWGNGLAYAKGTCRLIKLAGFSLGFITLPVPFAKPLGIAVAFIGYMTAKA